MGADASKPFKRGSLSIFPPIGDTNNYKWEKPVVVNPELYLISNESNAICGRLPHENSYIYVFDHVNTVTVDECVDCTILFGAIQTSIFIRFCESCTVLTACRQFRVRDCKNITAFLACVSDPIIETSSSVQFAPYHLFYPELAAQFRAAGLNRFNCSYSSIHDFSARGASPVNYGFLPLSETISKHVRLPHDLESKIDSASDAADVKKSNLLRRLKSVNASLDPDSSIVPTTYASLLINKETDGAFALVNLFHHPMVENHAWQIIKRICAHSVYLVRSRELQYSREDITRIFGDSTLASHSFSGPVITLQFWGPTGEVGRLCQEIVDDIVRKELIRPATLIHVTQDSVTASQQADMLARFPVSRN